VTVWLVRTRHARWPWLLTGLPAAWMYAMSMWELARIIRARFTGGLTADPLPWVAVLLVSLALIMLVEAVKTFLGFGPRPPHEPDRLAVAAAS
jgi:hypothetical protein